MYTPVTSQPFLSSLTQQVFGTRPNLSAWDWPIHTHTMSLKFPAALKELRIHFGQGTAGSQAVKSFVEKNYASLKKTNPNTPILIREALGIKPVAYARFSLGKEEKASLDGDVGTALKNLIEKGH